jgi:FkbM family methyltransferase
MSFVSYAQNFEDVMLWRALKHVEKGFYIDVGAWSPESDSVTKAFYDRGWRGINIEPDPEMCDRFKNDRRDDTNLCVAVADFNGEYPFHRLGNSGLSTLDKRIAGDFESRGMDVRVFPVPVLTLNKIWKEHVGRRDVHFLKVDVEGFEERVIRGNNWRRHRPWILVVEAMQPMSQVESYHVWEPILLQADYLFAYADGINRFYVAKEHEELLDNFKYPPNFFDDFRTSALHESQTELGVMRSRNGELLARTEELRSEVVHVHAALDERNRELADLIRKMQGGNKDMAVMEDENKRLTATASELRMEVERLNAHVHHWWKMADSLNGQLTAVHSSWSWRITAPLRRLADFIIAGFSLLQRRAKRARAFIYLALLGPLAGIIRFVLSRPGLSRRLSCNLPRYPWLYQRIIEAARQAGLLPASPQEHILQQSCSVVTEPPAFAKFTPKARRIYEDLKAAMARRGKGKD